MRRPSSVTRYLASAAVTALLASGLGGCQTMGDVAGALTSKSTEANLDSDPRRAAEVYGERYRANPKDTDAALRYGQVLRSTGQRAQAVAMLEQASITNPGNKALLASYGRALVDNGNFKQAYDVLSRAHSPANPDWRILSVQGTALDQMGKHEEARGYYASALRLKPDDPSVLSNLGLSYALSKNLREAEATLRRAAAQPGAEPKVRQNLALVIGLQGRFQEAETVAKGDLSPDEAAANVAYLRQMLAQQSDWKKGKRGSPLVPTTGS